MVDAAQNTTVSYSVVINPNSGPGDVAEDVYTQGIYDLWNVGIEVRSAVGVGLWDTKKTIRTLGVYIVWLMITIRGFMNIDLGQLKRQTL